MIRIKRLFLCTLLTTVAFIPIKNDIIFAKEKSGVNLEVVEQNSNLFNEKIIWKPGNLEESVVTISNNLDKDIVIKNLYFHDENLLDWLSFYKIDKNNERYQHFLENSTLIVKDNKDVVFKGSFKDVFSKGIINLEKAIEIGHNNSKPINLAISVSEDLDNRGQGIQHAFKFIVKYEYNSNNENEYLPNTGGVGGRNVMICGVIALGIGASILKLPQKGEDI